MKLSLLFGLCLICATPSQSQGPFTNLTVYADMDVYRAGGYNDGSNGVQPVAYTFRAQPGRTVEFASVLGLWTCADNNPAAFPFGPDGLSTENPCYPRAAISNPVGPFSGYATTDFTGALAGVFLENTLPAQAPPPLRFYVQDASQGGIATSFRVLSPEIGQVFFVGDGLTGTKAGQHQSFNVPPTATHLYLGYVDSCSASGFTQPGCYSDNAGQMLVLIRLH